MFFVKHIGWFKQPYPPRPFDKLFLCAALSFLPTVRLSAHGEALKILRTEGS
jgi:hypothetical protein